MEMREETPGASVASAGVPWGKANSNSAKYWTTFKEFQIVRHHAPGGFNYLDICWVITAAIRWLLNSVEDSFMRQWVKTQPEVKSFWPGLRTGGCASKDEGPSESRAQICSRDGGWYSCWDRGVFQANDFTEQISLTVSESKQTKNHCICGKSWLVMTTASVSRGRGFWVLTQIFRKVYKDWGK